MKLNDAQTRHKRRARLSMIAYIPVVVILAIIILAADEGNPLRRVLEAPMIALAMLAVINSIAWIYYKMRYGARWC